MTKKTLLSLLLALCLSLPGFAKSRTIENPSSFWMKLVKQANERLGNNRSKKTHAKAPPKTPYEITALDWNSGASAYKDSTEKYVMRWNADSTPKQMVIYAYENPMIKLVIDSFIMKSGGEAFNAFEFLGDWLPVQSIAYAKVGGQWILSQKITITYSSRGKENILYEDWSGGTWVNAKQEYYLFDTHDMPLGYLNQKWTAGDWENVDGEQVKYTYDGDGNPVEAVFMTMEAGATDWTPAKGIIKEVYALNFSEEIGSALIYWSNGNIDSIADIEWSNYTAAESGFLSAGGDQYISYTVYSWDDDESVWELEEKYTKDYNSSGQEIEEIEQSWDDGSSEWVNESRSTSDYFPSGDIMERISYDWSGSQWVMSNGGRWTYSFDDDGDLIQEAYDSYDGSDWVKDFRVVYNYTAPAGINKLSNKAAVRMYPNPASSKLIVELDGAPKNYTFSVFSLSGQLVSVLNATSGNISLDISTLNSGMYLLRVQAGDTVRTSTFVKR